MIRSDTHFFSYSWRLGTVLLILLPFIITSGCASGYQRFESGVGYVDFPLRHKGQYFISYSANGYTSVEETFEMAEKRIKELGQKKGYKFYRLVEVNKGASDDQVRVGPHGETKLYQPIVNLIVQYYSTRPEDGKSIKTIP